MEALKLVGQSLSVPWVMRSLQWWIKHNFRPPHQKKPSREPSLILKLLRQIWLVLLLVLFGPIDIDPSSETYGYITTTPKSGWANVDLLGQLSAAFKIPFDVTTDVNSSAYGEVLARPGVESLVYYTIGTGIGAGAIQHGHFIGV